MKPYEEAIVDLLDQKGPYKHGFKGWIIDYFTAQELIEFAGVYNTVKALLAHQFVDDIVREAVWVDDFEFREEILALVPADIIQQINEQECD